VKLLCSFQLLLPSQGQVVSSGILSPCPSFTSRDKLSYLYKTTGNITVADKNKEDSKQNGGKNFQNLICSHFFYTCSCIVNEN
jgi:hypothetical protein